MVTDVKKLPIQFDRDRVVAFCRERGIVRLSVFGSVLRDDFDPVSYTHLTLPTILRV